LPSRSIVQCSVLMSKISVTSRRLEQVPVTPPWPASGLAGLQHVNDEPQQHDVEQRRWSRSGSEPEQDRCEKQDDHGCSRPYLALARRDCDDPPDVRGGPRGSAGRRGNTPARAAPRRARWRALRRRMTGRSRRRRHSGPASTPARQPPMSNTPVRAPRRSARASRPKAFAESNHPMRSFPSQLLRERPPPRPPVAV